MRVLQASSAEIFGEPAKAPQDESTPIRPTSPYGAAKAFAHQLVSVYRTARPALRPPSSCTTTNRRRRPTSFVTRKITRRVAEIALGRADELVLGNLDARRDWGWAPDYVDAMQRALRYPDPDDYVVATGHDRSVRDFVAAAFARVGIDSWESLVRIDAALLRRGGPFPARRRCREGPSPARMESDSPLRGRCRPNGRADLEELCSRSMSVVRMDPLCASA